MTPKRTRLPVHTIVAVLPFQLFVYVVAHRVDAAFVALTVVLCVCVCVWGEGGGRNVEGRSRSSQAHQTFSSLGSPKILQYNLKQ